MFATFQASTKPTGDTHLLDSLPSPLCASQHPFWVQHALGCHIIWKHWTTEHRHGIMWTCCVTIFGIYDASLNMWQRLVCLSCPGEDNKFLRRKATGNLHTIVKALLYICVYCTMHYKLYGSRQISMYSKIPSMFWKISFQPNPMSWVDFCSS